MYDASTITLYTIVITFIALKFSLNPVYLNKNICFFCIFIDIKVK